MNFVSKETVWTVESNDEIYLRFFGNEWYQKVSTGFIRVRNIALLDHLAAEFDKTLAQEKADWI